MPLLETNTVTLWHVGCVSWATLYKTCRLKWRLLFHLYSVSLDDKVVDMIQAKMYEAYIADCMKLFSILDLTFLSD